MKDILKEAKRKFPKGSYFLSATGNLKSPLKVIELRVSEIYPDCIVNSEGGVVYEGGNWAERVG